jgi:methylthioribose-1-phosphate isomerase
MKSPSKSVRPPTLQWQGSFQGYLEIIDQRQLPAKPHMQRLETVEDVWHAIRSLAVRGAPAIGVAAAYGMVLAARLVPTTSQAAALIDVLKKKGAYLKSSRPTAVNLEWAVDAMIRTAIAERGVGVRQLQQRLLNEAHAIAEQDRKMCKAIGTHGAAFIRDGMRVLTHCNAGALATAGDGTALSILYEAQRRKIAFTVYADETRPLLQGARLTAWELMTSGIDVTVLCDNAAGVLMREKKVDLVIVGADRIARNGDTANKIGTYSVAVLARANDVPFIVAAPATTFDLSIKAGMEIPIEERDGAEVTHLLPGMPRTAPEGVQVFNPAFDVTPAGLITAIVTDRGVIMPVNEKAIQKMISV